ncbi:MAG: hypothetical protein OEY57_13155 [Nitrospirota bacterium]|nr:hypothetical protein [Nitrospirota bacterium]
MMWFDPIMTDPFPQTMPLTPRANQRTSSQRFYSALFGVMVVLILINSGCSRSPWIKTDGHEVSPTEHLECAHNIQRHSQGEVLEQEVLTQRVEQCMLDKGYKRRPWWLLNDLRWDIKEPAY